MFTSVRSHFALTRSSLTSVLSTRQARAVAASSALARLPKGMIPIATVLALREAHTSFALAGLTVGLVAVGDATTTPLQGRLVDRLGLAGVLLPLAVVHVVAIAGLLLSLGSAPEPVIVACAVVAGVGIPPVSGSVKAVWPRVVPPDAVTTAYTVESLLQQLVFLSGPLVVSGLVVVVGPAASLATAAGLVVVGTTWFVVVAPASRGAGPGARRRGAWRDRTVSVLAVSALLQGCAFGGLPVAMVAVAHAARHVGLAGVVQAMLTTGGVLGTAMPAGAADGRSMRRLVTAFGLALVPLVPLALHPTALTLVLSGVVLLGSGLLLTPIAATSYVIVQRGVDASRRTESFAWLSTGQATGNALGAALVGAGVDRLGIAPAMTVLPTAVLGAAVVTRLLTQPDRSS